MMRCGASAKLLQVESKFRTGCCRLVLHLHLAHGCRAAGTQPVAACHMVRQLVGCKHAAVPPRHRQRLVEGRRGQPLLLVVELVLLCGRHPAATTNVAAAAVERAAAAVAGIPVAALGVGRSRIRKGAARGLLLQEAVDVRRLPPLWARARVNGGVGVGGRPQEAGAAAGAPCACDGRRLLVLAVGAGVFGA